MGCRIAGEEVYAKTLSIPKMVTDLNPERMFYTRVGGPMFANRKKKLARQLPWGVTFAYIHCLGHTRECWKYFIEEKNNENLIQHEFDYDVP